MTKTDKMLTEIEYALGFLLLGPKQSDEIRVDRIVSRIYELRTAINGKPPSQPHKDQKPAPRQKGA